MHVDELFPVETLPPRARNAVLQEFKGRTPTIQEVDQIPEKYWLLTPNLGQSSVARILRISKGESWSAGAPLKGLTDEELLDRLTFLQNELRSIRRLVKQMVQGHRNETLSPPTER